MAGLGRADELLAGCQTVTGQDPSAEQTANLLAFLDLLSHWNQSYNLTAIRNPAEMVSRHLLDSLAVTPWLYGSSVLDVGTGGGLPGVPLAIMNPALEVTLLDSVGKKIRFLRHVKRELGLSNVYPVQSRLEQFTAASASSEPFTTVISRAFSELGEFARASRHLMHADTRLLAMKGRFPEQELKALPEWVRVEKTEKLSIPGLHEQRHLVIMSLSASP